MTRVELSLMLAVIACGAAFSMTASGGVGGSNSPPAARDAVWRSIFARPQIVETTPSEDAKAALGFALFRDTRLSGDGTLACASCHDPERAFSDGRPKGKARDGSALKRNTPSLYNLAASPHFFADGRAASLEAQARVPITAADEMAGEFKIITERLAADPETAAKFAAAFPQAPAVSETTLLAALAAYERTLVSPETRFDRWVAGDDTALSDQERDGFTLFVGKGGCVGCHGGWRFTDDGFRDIGLPGDDPGRSALTGGPPDLRQFKTPGLRELTHTAPYMHDGSLATLRDVVNHYAGGFVKRPSLDSNLVRDLTLVDKEKADLAAFLQTLSSEK